jgi:hypothetical protein
MNTSDDEKNGSLSEDVSIGRGSSVHMPRITCARYTVYKQSGGKERGP